MSTISFNEFKFKYRFDCALSQGSFGRVCRIQQIGTKKYYALKKVTVKKKQQLQDIQNQIRLLQRFRHPFVVQIKETYNIQIKNGFAKPVWEVGLVMELAKCSLEHIIKMRKSAGSYQFIGQQIVGLIKILYILQKQNIAHRDIKPANILVFENIQNVYHWKLADFGLALDMNRVHEENNFAGSFEYASPKLKRKFKYPNLKIRTNPFKDDVYSLGVTLLQTITGCRSYVSNGFDKLREICQDPRLINLIDIMLEEDQQKRPCFKQLMLIIQKQFNNIHKIAEIQNRFSKPFDHRPKSRSRSKQSWGYEGNTDPMLDKTVIKKTQKVEEFKARKKLYHTGRPITSVTSIDQIVMCGCEDGSIIFIENEKIIEGGKIHKKNISQLFNDTKGNIYSLGHNTLFKHCKNTLRKHILSHTLINSQNPPAFLHKANKNLPYILQQFENTCTQIKLPYHHHCGCSCVYVMDQDHLAVGYYDGYVYVRWDGMEFHGRMFDGGVTGVKLGSGRLWFCSIDGKVKAINTKDVYPEPRLYLKQKQKLINIHLTPTPSNPTLNIITLSGIQLMVTQQLECVYQNTISGEWRSARSQIKQTTQLNQLTIIASVDGCNNNINNNKNNKGHNYYYMLTLNGQIIDSNQDVVVELGGKGWACLAVTRDREILVGGFQGIVAVVD